MTEAVSASANEMVSSLASDPFSPQGETVFARVRAMARLGHELVTVEAKLRNLYEQARKLSKHEPAAVVRALPNLSKNSLVKLPQQELVDDVTDKREKLPRTSAEVSTAKLTSNDQKLLSGLKASLNRTSWKRMTQSAMASASGLPSGSVEISLK